MNSTTPAPNNTHIVRIKAVNGLLFLTYDDSTTTSNNQTFLSSKGVTHVLSIVHGNAGKSSQTLDALSAEDIEVKQTIISNSPAPDVLSSLNEACKWIENALSSSSTSAEQNTNQVLIKAEGDCDSVIANAVIIGFIMRYLRTTFSTSLRLAQDSIPSITVDNNMERQLRIWDFCRYNIYQIDPQSVVSSPRPSIVDTPMNMPGTWPLSRANTGTVTPTVVPEGIREHSLGLHKPAYLAWKKECDALMAAERSRALSKMVALVAKTKIGRESDGITGACDSVPNGCAKDLQSRGSKEAQWARVDEMEKNWNEKLMKGAVMA